MEREGYGGESRFTITITITIKITGNREGVAIQIITYSIGYIPAIFLDPRNATPRRHMHMPS
jgi:hypothetical protein